MVKESRMKIKCSNPECSSHNEEIPAFTLVMVFDEDKDPLEDVKKIPPEFFECTHCGSSAEVA